jgi:uncharacterized membrane protein YqaE (UPF0057 family)
VRRRAWRPRPRDFHRYGLRTYREYGPQEGEARRPTPGILDRHLGGGPGRYLAFWRDPIFTLAKRHLRLDQTRNSRIPWQASTLSHARSAVLLYLTARRYPPWAGFRSTGLCCHSCWLALLLTCVLINAQIPLLILQEWPSRTSLYTPPSPCRCLPLSVTVPPQMSHAAEFVANSTYHCCGRAHGRDTPNRVCLTNLQKPSRQRLRPSAHPYTHHSLVGGQKYFNDAVLGCVSYPEEPSNPHRQGCGSRSPGIAISAPTPLYYFPPCYSVAHLGFHS